jgi:hypothetical protein
MSTRKPFDKKMFDATDNPAREVIRDYIGRSGLFVRDNPDTYGPDLIVYKGFKPLSFVEVEVKLVWKPEQNVFPWDTIQLPERKLKFLNLGLPIEFFILRADLERAVLIHDHVVAKSPIEEVKNKYVKVGELFCKIDIRECQVIDITPEKSNESDKNK